MDKVITAVALISFIKVYFTLLRDPAVRSSE